jgi:DNA polymerase
MDKDRKLSKLKNSILKFNKNFPGKNLVFSDGNKEAKIMIVGEAPGRTEDKLQKPFVGRAGKLLDSLLKSINLNRSKVYITNVVNYRPDKNRKPNLLEINLFKKYLFQHIEIIKPKFILLLGSTAAEAVLDYQGPLNLIIGKFFEKKIINITPIIMTVYHPAYLLRQPKNIKTVNNNLNNLKKYIKKT